MEYFKEVIDRRHNSVKVARMVENKNFVDDGKTLPFTVADMCFKVMPEVKEAINTYLESNTLGYTFPWESYYQSITDFFNDVHDFEVKREEVLTFTGVVPMIDAIIKAMTQPGDGIVIFSPVYGPFFSTIENSGRKLIDCPLINDNNYYTIDFDCFDKLAQDENTKMVLFCSPHNPVSRVWTKEELNKLVEIAKKNNLLIISDEIHSDIILNNHVHIPLATLAPDITFTCTSPSKTFNLASSNCANLIVKNSKLYGEIVKYNAKQPHNWVNALGLAACEAAYNHHEEWMKQLKELLETNYQLLINTIGHLVPTSPLEGTYLIWADFRAYDNDEFEDILQQHNVFLTNGSMYGEKGKGYYRINIACPTEYIEILCQRILDVLSSGNVSRETL